MRKRYPSGTRELYSSASDAEKTHEYNTEYRRVRFIHITSMVLSCMGFAYAVFNLIVDRFVFVWSIGVGSACMLLLFFLSFGLKRARFITVLYLILIYAQLFLSLVFSNKANSSLIWMALAPVITFYLMGSRAGIRLSAVFIVIVSAYLALLPREVLPFLAIVNVGYGLTIFSVIMYFYERSREMAGDALEQSRAELYVISRTDALTGLKNRFCIDQILTGHFALLHGVESSFGTGLTLIIIDIDHFKIVNDTFGHPKGDAVLKSIALILRQAVVGKGDAGRWGGEEFLLVFRDMKRCDAQNLAETIRMHTQALRFDDPELRVTISQGVAELRDGDDAGSLLKRADACLYQAKREGRNRVVSDQEFIPR